MAIYVDTSTQVKKKNRLLAGVFGWVFIGLLITIVSAYAVGFILVYSLTGRGSADFVSVANMYSWLMILSVTVHLVLTITMNVMLIRNRRDGNIMVPYILYTANFGIMLSPYVLLVESATLGIGLGMALLLFGVMYLVARFSKANLRPLGMIGGSLFIGLLLISLITAFLPTSTGLYWFLSLGSFAAIMLITMYDIWVVVRMDRELPEEYVTRNLQLALALRIYIDFIWILVRIIQFVAISRSYN